MIPSKSISHQPSVLIIDDDPLICNLLGASFRGNKFHVQISHSLSEARNQIKSKLFDAVLIDVFLGEDNGIKNLQDLINLNPATCFFTMTGHDTVSLAVEAMELGATSFFPKSLGSQKIVDLVKTKLSISDSNQFEVSKSFEDFDLIGRSKEMQKVFSQIYQFQNVDSTLLITGESGTGKEVVAKTIHRISNRKNGPFEAINCGAIPENLLESELFGHKRGSFTDAKADKIGLFEACSKGTLMLDEIGDMPLSLQVKLLRVLQEKEVRPIGSNKTIKVNPRIIASTHRNLSKMVEEKLFRQDLFYRLSVLKICIPPLRERPQDIPLLTNKFITTFNIKFKKHVTPPSQELLSRLKSHTWPGNIRELQNAIERGIVLSMDKQLHYEDIFSDENDNTSEISSSAIPLVHNQAKKEFEKNYVVNLLKESKGNISQASRISGKHRVEIYRLIEKHQINKKNFMGA